MYRMDLNNYHLKPKNSTIYTPSEVSEFIFDLLSPYFPDKSRIIFDPCSGKGSLLKPWFTNHYLIFGIDVKTPALILCNPPFNGYKGKLAPEIWLDKIIELFGKDIPLVLFVPAGFTLNLTLESERHRKFEQGIYPPISSRITLPKNIFEGVIFHSEILIFNIPNLQPHYFYHHEPPN